MPYIIFTLLVFGGVDHVRSQFQYAFRGRVKRKSYSYFGGLRFDYATGI